MAKLINIHKLITNYIKIDAICIYMDKNYLHYYTFL